MISWDGVVFVLAFCGAVYGLVWIVRAFREGTEE
jgi:hypothetical protein